MRKSLNELSKKIEIDFEELENRAKRAETRSLLVLFFLAMALLVGFLIGVNWQVDPVIH